jgi:hypothetical protein
VNSYRKTDLVMACCIILGLSGCELAFEGAAELGETGLIAEAGDTMALSRVVGAEGAAMSEAEASDLSSAAARRTPIGLGAAPISDEVAIVRVSSRVLSYPDNYPVARFNDLTVTKESGMIVGTIRRFDGRLVVRNSNGEIVGESVLDGSRILHYTDSSHGTLRGYSERTGMMLKHWLYDENGNPVYFGSETIRIPAGTPPNRLTVPSEFFVGIQQQSWNSQAPASNMVAQALQTKNSLNIPASLLAPSVIPLQHDGTIVHFGINEVPKLVWSNGYVDIWEDGDVPHHFILPPATPLVFPRNKNIRAISRSFGATALYILPIDRIAPVSSFSTSYYYRPHSGSSYPYRGLDRRPQGRLLPNSSRFQTPSFHEYGNPYRFPYNQQTYKPASAFKAYPYQVIPSPRPFYKSGAPNSNYRASPPPATPSQSNRQPPGRPYLP